jgi:hypothetical protein
MAWKELLAATDLLKYLGHITGVDEPGENLVSLADLNLKHLRYRKFASLLKPMMPRLHR